MRASWRGEGLRLAISRRAVTSRQFAGLCGIRPETLSRALNGRSTSAETTRRIITTLTRLPELTGADLIASAK